MDFYVEPLWYWFVCISLITNFLNLFGAANDGSKSRGIHFLWGLVSWLIIVTSFIFTGLIGGMALLMVLLFIIGPIAQRLSFVVFKLVHRPKYLTYKFFKIRDEFREEERKLGTVASVNRANEKIKLYLQTVKTSRNALEFYEENGIDINKIDEIHWTLMASGVGDFVTYCVIRNPDLVLKYIEMEEKGYTPREISYEFLKGLEGVRAV